jgi:UDP-2,3-diacylglucosamine pyrophosphatase LpxH
MGCKGMKRFFISDLHFCDGGRSDEFNGNQKALRTFLASIPDRSLILVGDILDLLRAPLDSILKAHGEEIKLLMEKTEYYVTGNHDREMLGKGPFMGVPVVEKLLIGQTLVMHLNQFDLVNSEGNVLGDVITRTVDWMADHISPKIQNYARKVEQWARKLGRFGSTSTYREKALNYIRYFNCRDVKIVRIIGGHTHKFDNAKDGPLQYWNDGCWLYPKHDFLILEI